MEVIDVDRPDPASRRAKGKSDPLDAYAAARVVASGRAGAVPKSRDGIVESIRCLRVARRSAVKAKTQCINQIRGLLVNGPAELREQMKPLTMTKLVNTLARLRPAGDVACPATACRRALRSLARRHVSLTAEIRQLDRDLVELTTAAAPGLMAKFGVRVDVTAHLLVIAGDNPQRRHSEASFAHLTGRADPGLVGSTDPAPAQSWRRPSGEPCDSHGRTGAHALRRPHARLRATAHQRGAVEEGHHPMPQTSHRPGNVPRHQQSRQPDSRRSLWRLDIFRSIPALFLPEHLERAEPDLLHSMLKTFIESVVSDR